MYLPPAFALEDNAQIAALVRSAGAADLVTVDERHGLQATLLPVLWEQGPDGAPGRLLGHLARANPQFGAAGRDSGNLSGNHSGNDAGTHSGTHSGTSSGTDSRALAIVHGPQAYVSPVWYPSKAEHGRAVPTWNYLSVHFTGRLIWHDDPHWLLDLVTRLTAVHEQAVHQQADHQQARTEPWTPDDAPEVFISGQLRAIVGVELIIDRVEAKAKWSQNRGEADRTAVVAQIGDPMVDLFAATELLPNARFEGDA